MGDLASGGLRSVLILDILREVSSKKTVYKERELKMMMVFL